MSEKFVLDRFDYTLNLGNAGIYREYRSAFRPPSDGYEVSCLDLVSGAPDLGEGFPAGPATLKDDILQELAGLKEKFTIVAGQVSTWYGKEVKGLPTAFACRRDDAGQELVDAALAGKEETEDHLRALHADLCLGDLPASGPATLFHMAGEGNLHPEHIAYFLPEDEGVKHSPLEGRTPGDRPHRCHRLLPGRMSPLRLARARPFPRQRWDVPPAFLLRPVGRALPRSGWRTGRRRRSRDRGLRPLARVLADALLAGRTDPAQKLYQAFGPATTAPLAPLVGELRRRPAQSIEYTQEHLCSAASVA